jgi:hypothetical protein
MSAVFSIGVTKLTAEAAESDERPLHSVIFKIFSNYALALSTILDFDFSSIELPEAPDVDTSAASALAGSVTGAVPTIEMPEFVTSIMEKMTAFTGAFEAATPELAVNCMVSVFLDGDYKTRYTYSAYYWMIQPALLLIFVTIFSAGLLVFQRWAFKQMDKWSAWASHIVESIKRKMLKVKEGGMQGLEDDEDDEEKEEEKVEEEEVAEGGDDYYRFFSIWRIDQDGFKQRENFQMRFQHFYEDMIPVWMVSIFFIWQQAMERFFFMVQCEDYNLSEWHTLNNFGDPTTRGGSTTTHTSFWPGYEDGVIDGWFDSAYQQRWTTDMDFPCGVGTQAVISSVGMAGLVFWIFGYVLLSWGILYNYKEFLAEAEILRKYGFLYLGYDIWFWECVKRLQAFCYGLISSVPMGDPKARLILFALLAGVNAVMHIYMEPYDDRKGGLLDKIESRSLLAIFVTMVLIQLIITFSLGTVETLVVGMVICIMNAMFLSYLGFFLFREFLFHKGHETMAQEREKKEEERMKALDERKAKAEAEAKAAAKRALMEKRRKADLKKKQARTGIAMEEPESPDAKPAEVEQDPNAMVRRGSTESITSDLVEPEADDKKQETQALVEKIKQMHPWKYMSRVVTRGARLRSRLALVETGPLNVKATVCPRTPPGYCRRLRYVLCGYEPDTPCCAFIATKLPSFLPCASRRKPASEIELYASASDTEFLYLMVLKYFEMLFTTHKWDNIDGELFQFCVRVLFAFCQRERFINDKDAFPPAEYPHYYEEPEDDPLGELMPRGFDGEEDEMVSLTELHTVPVYNIPDSKGIIAAQKAHFEVGTVETAMWGAKDIPDSKSFFGDELFRAFEKAKKMSGSETLQLLLQYQEDVRKRVKEQAEVIKRVLKEQEGEEGGVMTDVGWSHWKKKGQGKAAVSAAGADTFLPKEYERPVRADKSNLIKAITQAGAEEKLKEKVVTEEPKHVPLHSEQKIRDLQNWRDTRKKERGAESEAATLAVADLEEQLAVAQSGFPMPSARSTGWTGLQGALEPQTNAPPNSFVATIATHGPLGIEVEWSKPPKMYAVAPGSLAQRAGMRAGDLLLRVDDVDIIDWPADRIATLFGKRPLRMTMQHTTAALPDVNLRFEEEEDEDERELAV